MRHSKNGGRDKGSLTEEQIQKIQKLFYEEGVSRPVLAERFGVSSSSIARITKTERYARSGKKEGA